MRDSPKRVTRLSSEKTSGLPPGKSSARQSLRTRLAVWNAAVVILTAVTTLVILRQGVTWALFREIDEILKEDVVEIGLMLTETPRDKFDVLAHELDRKAIGHQHHGWFVKLRDADRKLLWSSTGRTGVAAGADNADSPEPDVSEARLQSRDQHDITRPAPVNPHGVKFIVVGTQLTLLRHDLSRIDELVVLTATMIFAVAPLFAYWLAGRATHAVGEITRTALRLRPDHLEERLPLRGTGDELDQLALTINGLLDRIAVFLDQKRDVLANAAHELRTPLAAIRASVEVALNEERTTREYQELLEEIIDQSGSLQTLLNQLLLLSEAEAERLKTQLEVVELDRLVSRSAAMFQGVADVREISLKLEHLEPCRVAGNKVHLQQVVNNLIDNALKYTPAGGRVQVSLTVSPLTQRVEFKVKDSGIGISEDDLPRVFDRFFRVDRTRGRRDAPDGTGLGLSICKAVVEAYGGSIRCDSVRGEGTEFRVALPLSPVQELDSADRELSASL